MLLISEYQIVEELYLGETSVIYRACKSGKPVILKILREEYPSVAELQALKQEHEILEKIRNSKTQSSTQSSSNYGSVQTLGMEKIGNRPFLVFEDIGGKALSEILGEIQKLSTSEVLTLMIQAVKALGEIHSLGIVHKDIKPHNIVFNKSTKELQIIDFGSASFLAKQNSFTALNSSIEGTLAYISPEQTGRMNRTLDYRSDYYSLGVTLYQLLTGKLPFTTDDPMEMVHSHIAKIPLPPIDNGLSLTNMLQPLVSDIVMKLLQKNPEDRYQSIAGLLHDLEWCLNSLAPDSKKVEKSAVASPLPLGEGNISIKPFKEFRLGERDFSGKFQIPEKLYGRTKEIQQIIDSFKNIVMGNVVGDSRDCPLHIISGRSGIGKSALINEINKPIIEYKGYFASGKYDQFKRAIPYYAIGQAFQSLIQQILTSSQTEIEEWKNILSTALGSNGKVMTDLIPELENLIGEQPAAIELGSSESQNRFNLVFQNFIQAFCTKEHPIAIFLDDLQWADNPSITLIQTILSNPEVKYLYLMLSFRDNEVLPTDSFSLMLENLKKAGFIYKEILLEPISVLDITHLVSDTLNCEESKAKELATILFEKTKGNPFFVNETFKSLYERDLLKYKDGVWVWDIQKIRDVKISENVIDLMVEKVKELSPNQIELLKLAACLGDSFELDTFFQLTNQELATVNQELTTISNEGFLLLTKNTVRFIHDKVREATYSLMEEKERTQYHYQIGKLLLENTPLELLEDRIFNILEQLNLGKNLIHSSREKLELIRLNLKAGKKAKASIAYEPAFNFLKNGTEILPENKWEVHYELCLEIYKELAECEYLLTHFKEADQIFAYVLENAKTILDKIPTVHIQLRQKATEGKGDEAFTLGFSILNELGVKMPDPSTPDEVNTVFAAKLEKYKELLGEMPIPELFHLPEMKDKNILEAISLVTNLGDIAIVLRPDLLGLMSILGVVLSIEFGNAKESAISYVMWGVLTNIAFKDYRTGYELGQIGIKLNEDKFPSEAILGKCLAFYGWNINHWLKSCREDLAIAKKGYELTMKNSDIVYAGYFIAMFPKVSFYASLPLEEVVNYSNKAILFGEKYKYFFVPNVVFPTLQIALALQGKTEFPTSLNGTGFDEEKYLEDSKAMSAAQGLAYYYFRKLQLYFIFGEYQKSLEIFPDLDKSFFAIPRHIVFGELQFFSALVILNKMHEFTDEEKSSYGPRLAENYNYLKNWAELCEENFQHQLLLIEAEKARVEGRDLDAMQLYEKSIESARKYEYIQNAAIANELAANFYLSKGLDKVASVYMQEAQYLYKLWGAAAKVKQLEEKYPKLKRQAAYVDNLDKTITISQRFSTESIGRTSKSSYLDLETIIKASQAISGEIQLGKLLEKMMKILFENAGAERGFFILKDKGKFKIEAEGSANSDKISVLQSQVLEDNTGLSTSIVNYVGRTKSIVLLNDAVKKGIFINDEYVKVKQPKSILCYPVVHHGNLIGIVYLENNLTTNAFTPNRVEILNILSTQIAVSVENSLLYSNLEEKVEERTSQVNAMLDQLRKLYLDSENKRKEIESLAESRKKLSLVGQMAAGIVHDIKNPMASIKYLAETLSDRDATEETKAENLSLILREMDRLTDLTYEILDFSKGQLNLDWNEINVKEFLTDIEKFLALDFEYMGVKCVLDLQYTGSIRMDKDRMRRVIVNIAKNALEAMYDGKKEYMLIIRSVQETDKIILSLIDNGHGLPESVKENMFQAFATEGKAKGTGLGLFMCKWIVDTHGGELTYQTETGKGTSFHIHLFNS